MVDEPEWGAAGSAEGESSGVGARAGARTGDAGGGDTGTADARVGAPTRKKPARWILRLVIGFIIVRTLAANLADIFFPALLESEDGGEGNPLLLMALNTRKRFLVTAKDEPAIWYYTVGLLSQLLTDPLWFMIGRWYGDSGIRWAERKFGDVVTQVEGMFKKAAYPMVAIAPNVYICLMAGAYGMSTTTFFALNIGGTVAALIFYRVLGDVFSGPFDTMFGFIKRNQKWFIAFSAVVIGYQMWDQKRKGKQQVTSISKLESELEEAAASPDAAAAGGDHERPAGGKPEI